MSSDKITSHIDTNGPRGRVTLNQAHQVGFMPESWCAALYSVAEVLTRDGTDASNPKAVKVHGPALDQVLTIGQWLAGQVGVAGPIDNPSEWNVVHATARTEGNGPERELTVVRVFLHTLKCTVADMARPYASELHGKRLFVEVSLLLSASLNGVDITDSVRDRMEVSAAHSDDIRRAAARIQAARDQAEARERDRRG